jgi:hypothetical protein
MKYLSHYTENLQTELLNTKGAFFAFSNKQFDEQKKDGIDYVAMGSGLICPKPNTAELMQGIESINKTGIEADIAENGIKAIIRRELANHEAQITMDISDTVAKLSDYPGITRELIQVEYSEFYQHCIDNDYF